MLLLLRSSFQRCHVKILQLQEWFPFVLSWKALTAPPGLRGQMDDWALLPLSSAAPQSVWMVQDCITFSGKHVTWDCKQRAKFAVYSRSKEFFFWFVCFFDNDAILFQWRGGWEIRIKEFTHCFQHSVKGTASGGRVSRACETLRLRVMYVLFSLQKQKEENKTKKTLTLSRLKGKPVELPPIARLQSHNSRRAGTHSRPAFTAGSRSLVWLCERVCVCEHKHAEPGGGCEKSVDVEPTGTWRTNAKQRDVKC